MYHEGKYDGQAGPAIAGCFCNLLDCEHRRGTSPVDEVFQRLLEERERALRLAIDGWATQCGVTAEEWLKYFGCHVEDKYPDGGESFTVTFHVTPVRRDDAPEPRWSIKPMLVGDAPEPRWSIKPMLVGDTFRNGRLVRE